MMMFLVNAAPVVCVSVCEFVHVPVCAVQLWVWRKPHDPLMTECHVTITSTGVILSSLSAATACAHFGMFQKTDSASQMTF